MRKRRAILTAVIAAALIALVYFQYRSWEEFDWRAFWTQTRRAEPLRIALAIAIVHFVYVLRALRWKIFLRPVAQTSTWRLVPAMVIGFAGLALLGRPGELVRPYLVARRENLPVTSQIAVWMVERIFDLCSFVLLAAFGIFFVPGLRTLPYFDQIYRAGFVLLAAAGGVAFVAFLVYRNAAGVASWSERLLRWTSPRLAARASARVRAFSDGLHTIHDMRSFLELVGVSLAIWLLLALAYLQVAHAYPSPLREMTIAHVVLVMGFSMAGSVVLLPAVGGGTQLLTIAALIHVFRTPYELAVSCGILLWLVTFIAVVPLGLALARREHVSLRRLSEETEALEE